LNERLDFLSNKKPDKSAGKMEMRLDFTNIWYKSLDLMALSTETLGKASSPRKKTGLKGKLVQKHLMHSGLSRDVSPFDGQDQLPMVRRNE
jgi:hypothetical protein